MQTARMRRTRQMGENRRLRRMASGGHLPSRRRRPRSTPPPPPRIGCHALPGRHPGWIQWDASCEGDGNSCPPSLLGPGGHA